MDNEGTHEYQQMAAREERPSVQLWRWRVKRPGPHLTRALAIGETLKRAVTRVSCDRGGGLLPAGVYRDHSDAHRHAFWLPGDEDGDGLIDHAWVFCANGLPREVIAALAAVAFVTSGDQRYELEPDWMSPRLDGGPFGPARVWRAMTPYVTPNWRLSKTGRERQAFTPEAQFKSEVKQRGLPAVASVSWKGAAWIGDELVMASSFLAKRAKAGGGAQPPGDAVASFPTVTFTEPVLGPLAFGFGAHFGLGQLLPLQQ